MLTRSLRATFEELKNLDLNHVEAFRWGQTIRSYPAFTLYQGLEMTIQLKLHRKLAVIALSAFAVHPTFAADAVTDAMQAAYAPYRTALFKTNSNSQTEARDALAQAQQSWAQFALKFGSNPPAPYDRDSAFGLSITEVSKVYAKASEQVAANQLSEAHETLEATRDVLAELRRRNQIVVYSDHMNAFHSEMEHVIIEGPKILAQPSGVQQLTAQIGVLTYLGQKLATEAPAVYSTNAEFKDSLAAVQKSVADLRAALFSQNTEATKEAMKKLKSPYSKLFLKFG
jgi:hypothetical protein